MHTGTTSSKSKPTSSGLQIKLTLPSLYPKQHNAIYSEARYALCEAGTKTGKTAGCLVWFLEQAMRMGKDGRNFWWVAPVYRQAEIGFKRTRRMLRSADPDGRTWTANTTRLECTLINGGCMRFLSAEKPDNLYGEDVYALVVDEATRCREEAWHALRSTITATNAQVRLIGNVKGRKNWVYHLARKAEAGEPNHHYSRITCWDAVEAGILTREEIEEAERDLPPYVFRELYLAEASDDEGNPFGIEHIRGCIKGDAQWIGEGPVIAWGGDLAKYHDWTVMIGINAAGEVCAFQRWQSDWRNTTRRIIAMVEGTPAIIDATGVGDPVFEDIALACGAAEGERFTAAKKQEHVYGLASALHQREIGLPGGNHVIVSELESFQYSVNINTEGRITGVKWEGPVNGHDDCVTALACAVQCFRDRRYHPRIDAAIVVSADADEDDQWDDDSF